MCVCGNHVLQLHPSILVVIAMIARFCLWGRGDRGLKILIGRKNVSLKNAKE